MNSVWTSLNQKPSKSPIFGTFTDMCGLPAISSSYSHNITTPTIHNQLLAQAFPHLLPYKHRHTLTHSHSHPLPLPHHLLPSHCNGHQHQHQSPHHPLIGHMSQCFVITIHWSPSLVERVWISAHYHLSWHSLAPLHHSLMFWNLVPYHPPCPVSFPFCFHPTAHSHILPLYLSLVGTGSSCT